MKSLAKKWNWLFDREKGFALMTVMLMTAVLLILMLSLVSLSSQTLFQATSQVERAAIVPLAETAVNEVFLKLKSDVNWGLNTTDDKLLMIAKGQEVSVAGLDGDVLPERNAVFSTETRGCFYVSFDPGDTAFKGKPYYSVNNLDPINNPPPSTTSCRGMDVPQYAASIVVTAAVGNTVKHTEVIIKVVPTGGIKNGSRSQALIETDVFSLQSLMGIPDFHSNMTGNAAIEIYNPSNEVEEDVADASTVSANGNILFNGTVTDRAPFNSDAGERPIPNLDIGAVVDSTTFAVQQIPSGRYELQSGSLYYYDDMDLTDPAGHDRIISNGQDVVPGLKFQGGKLIVTKNLIVEADPDGVTGSGNLTILGVPVQFAAPPGGFLHDLYDGSLMVSKVGEGFDPSGGTENSSCGIGTGGAPFIIASGSGGSDWGGGGGSGTDEDVDTGLVSGFTIYAPGNGDRDPGNPNEYISGNITISDDNTNVLSGQGNIYTNGTLNISGKSIDSGLLSEVVAVYSDGDVRLNTKDTTKFKGLVYTYGDFICNSENQDLTIEGAIIVAGKDPDTDPSGFAVDPGEMRVEASEVHVNFDETVLGCVSYSGGTTSVGLCIVSWHEF